MGCFIKIHLKSRPASPLSKGETKKHLEVYKCDQREPEPKISDGGGTRALVGARSNNNIPKGPWAVQNLSTAVDAVWCQDAR